ncbi:hypothetical protein MINTM019_15280 [Mycobacterium paraintracellulare]|uniref:CsbD family protein n=2 Tax=Mycobacterium avium complex (MAC) TaxID=120793 RepID=A0ABM7KAI9_9MYCO|nr:hypothetical protein MPRI_32910 [Mycobacterium paraintracellulare]BCO56551.1 hypothetical protein MINTM005_17950 [Mycobacterium intracellulare]BCO83225.1 hypothetical protein MINTM011_15600 [Mycobacterium paraintracellulare]BCP04072.1 hypothetical protein MINTM019_15280 [Mycobacterium paraintracellulare]BCP09464.1 hypothetical protein MINTM020_15620 [Mycobacterium paraintracellulare]
MGEGEAMVDTKSGPVELVRGIVEDVLGRTKQVIGIIIGHNDLIEEGKAQQDKADAQRSAGKKEAAADKARGKAKAYEQRERAEQQ